MNKNMTALEWLRQEKLRKGVLFNADFEKAKAMEKQQIIKAFNEGTFSEMEKIDAEDYYNQTYGLPTEH